MSEQSPSASWRSTPNESEQEWLDATPAGESRTIAHRIGDLSSEFTVDRRVVRVDSVAVTNGVGLQLG